MTAQTERERRPGQDDALNAQMTSPATPNDEHEGTADAQMFCAFPRHNVAPSDFHRMARPRAEYRAGRQREPDAGADLPTRLDDDQRLARIRHAVDHAFMPWEIAALVPPPVTEAERDAARRNPR